MNVTLLDTKTGERADAFEYFEHEFDLYWWSGGNGSCDCNRMEVFGHGDPEETGGYCHGCERYLVVDASGDLEGYSREECIRMANEDYPPELVARFIPATEGGA
jgi:hypothetical protein